MPARRIAVALVSIFATALSLVFVEIVLALFLPIGDPYESMRFASPPNRYIRSEFPPGLRLETKAEEGLPGMAGVKSFRINELGYRGGELRQPKPRNEFRVFMIGGSTTECLYLDDSESIDAVLQDQLQQRTSSALEARVFNAGKSGDGIADHASMFVHRITQLEPDLITIFSGVNDLTRAIYGYDYLHRQQERGKEKLPLVKLLATEFQIPRRIHNLLRRLAPSDRDVQESITRVSNYRRKVELRKSVPAADDEPVVDLAPYAIYLGSLIGIARAHSIEIVLITQASSWNSAVDPSIRDWHWMTHRFGVTYREERMDTALERYNDVMRRIAAEDDVPLFDLARELPKSSRYFYDDVHFNVEGAATAGRGLASLIVAEGLIPASR